MKGSDYIVSYLVERGVRHAFGYPGGMVTHLMDSFAKYADKISAHVSYHEQGAAFEACGYAQSCSGVGVAYATSGPGATNLITGIGHAFFDSVPVLFITGQVNTGELKGAMNVRQRGFQETDIVSIVAPITKYAACVTKKEELKRELDRAFFEATSGRKGPVLLDIPMDVLRSEVEPDSLESYVCPRALTVTDDAKALLSERLSKSERPVLLLGGGIKSAGAVEQARELIASAGIPVVTSMLAVDIPGADRLNYGFIGAYGGRVANFIAAKADLIIAIGSRLDIRQVGARRERFAPDAGLIRFDIDEGELEYKVHADEAGICTDAASALSMLRRAIPGRSFEPWVKVCDTIRDKLSGVDDTPQQRLISRVSKFIPSDAIITADVGQNQVWMAQAFSFKDGQAMYTSGGHGAMGYALPAAIGCYLATGRPTYSFNGDGGFQMNMQELQLIVREKLPVKIIVFNNYALGMIRHFQEMYFNSRFFQTTEGNGYSVPCFKKIAEAYGIKYFDLSADESAYAGLDSPEAGIFEAFFPEKTYVVPKLEFGKPNQDQEPLIDRELYEEIMSL